MNMTLTSGYLNIILFAQLVALVVMILRIRTIDKRLKDAEASIVKLTDPPNDVPEEIDAANHQLFSTQTSLRSF